jgi:hypothetical protein
MCNDGFEKFITYLLKIQQSPVVITTERPPMETYKSPPKQSLLFPVSR